MTEPGFDQPPIVAGMEDATEAWEIIAEDGNGNWRTVVDVVRTNEEAKAKQQEIERMYNTPGLSQNYNINVYINQISE